MKLTTDIQSQIDDFLELGDKMFRLNKLLVLLSKGNFKFKVRIPEYNGDDVNIQILQLGIGGLHPHQIYVSILDDLVRLVERPIFAAWKDEYGDDVIAGWEKVPEPYKEDWMPIEWIVFE